MTIHTAYIVEDWTALKALRDRWKSEGLTIVFTNGVFDLLHSGHLDYLLKARALGDILILGLNTDASVRRLKGEKRPLVNQHERAFNLSCLRQVDYITYFDQDTPEEIIQLISPDVLVKGADYTEDEIVGADFVKSSGGQVVQIALTEGRSTSNLIAEIISRFSK
jgi:rfaE bifunctional protein nucleotidyltransferase chain/domain